MGTEIVKKGDIGNKPDVMELVSGLRKTTMPEIFAYVDNHWNSETVRVTLASNKDSISVPKGWHGEIKYGRANQGDAMVLFGDVLVEPIEGTRLMPDVFVEGLRGLDFSFEDGFGKALSDKEMVALLGSEASCRILSSKEEAPIVRAIKNDTEGKIILEVRNGSCSPIMQRLTALGNEDSKKLTYEKKKQYRELVSDCLGTFCAKGATAVRIRLGLKDYNRLTRFDDCLASGATFFGDQEIDAHLGIDYTNVLEEMRVSVASTQGITLAIKRAIDRKIPLLIRTGALSFGLGNREMGSNYLINTQSQMLDIGTYTVGDMGDRLANGREGIVYPRVETYGGERKNQTRVFLGGGLAMRDLLEEKLREAGKQPDYWIVVFAASRINPPAGEDGNIHDWGVIINGKRNPVFQEMTTSFLGR